jgi:hypothetical protein
VAAEQAADMSRLVRGLGVKERFVHDPSKAIDRANRVMC